MEPSSHELKDLEERRELQVTPAKVEPTELTAELASVPDPVIFEQKELPLRFTSDPLPLLARTLDMALSCVLVGHTVPVVRSTNSESHHEVQRNSSVLLPPSQNARRRHVPVSVWRKVAIGHLQGSLLTLQHNTSSVRFGAFVQGRPPPRPASWAGLSRHPPWNHF